MKALLILILSCSTVFADRELKLAWDHDKINTDYYVIRKFVPSQGTDGTWVDIARTVGTETTVTISSFPDTETKIHCVAIGGPGTSEILPAGTTYAILESPPSNTLIVPVTPNSPSKLSAKLIFTPTP